jgi:hypothetical protein
MARNREAEYLAQYRIKEYGIDLHRVKEETDLFFAVQAKNPNPDPKDWNAMYNTLVWRALRGKQPELLE